MVARVQSSEVSLLPDASTASTWAVFESVWIRIQQSFGSGFLAEKQFRSSAADSLEDPPAVLNVFPFVLRAGYHCVKGPYRAANEDRCYVDCDNGVIVVADGMGGHEGGQLASETVVDVLPKRLVESLRSDCDAQVALRRAFRATVRRLDSLADENPKHAKMGCTLVASAIVGDTLHVAHLGDCRAYLVRNGAIQRLTGDHTYVQALKDAGLITEEEARMHPCRHMVLKWLGTKPLEEPLDVSSVPLEAGDRLLFATDGLTSAIDDRRLMRVLSHVSDPQRAAVKLVELALKRRSKDNVACVVVHVESSTECVPDEFLDQLK